MTAASSSALIGSILADAEHGLVETVSQWSHRLGEAWTAGQRPAPAGSLGSVGHNEGYMPDRLTPASAEDVFLALGRVDPSLSRDSLLVLLSQWCLETGGGTSCHRWNLGNAKHVRGDGHEWTMFGCTEVLGGRVQRFEPPDPQTWFRAFSTLDEGAADYLGLLKHRFAVAWPAVIAGDVGAFGHALKLAHYYTADEHAYVALLVRLRGELWRQIAD